MKGDKVKKGAILADGPATDHGTLALGQNLLVAFVSWGGANFEDAIVLSSAWWPGPFTSIHIEDHYCDVRDTKLGPEVTTPDIPNVSEEKLPTWTKTALSASALKLNPAIFLVGKISP